MEVNLFAVYGSLRKGEYNYNAFGGDDTFEHVDTMEIEGFKLYGLGAYPGINMTHNTDDKVVFDIFKVTDSRTQQRIHGMELGAGYGGLIMPVIIASNYELVWVYVYLGDLSDYGKFIENGDWSKHLTKEHEEGIL